MLKYQHTLKRHKREKHGVIENVQKQKKISCSQCEKKFCQRRDMLRHLRTIHDNAYTDINIMDTSVIHNYRFKNYFKF